MKRGARLLGSTATGPMTDAMSMQRAAAREGFDWRETAELWSKLQEEIAELQAARSAAERKEEFGDLLFMLVNLARHLRIAPASALAAANRKFARRYGFVRRHLDRLPPLRDPARIDAMEALWQAAKRREREAPPAEKSKEQDGTHRLGSATAQAKRRKAAQARRRR